MTLLLAAIAVVLLVVIVAAIVLQSSDDEVLGVAPPPGSEFAAQTVSGSVNIAPDHAGEAVHVPLEEAIEAKAAEVAETRGVADFSPGNLGVGTTLIYHRVPSTIVGVISFDWDGVFWHDYLAQQQAGSWWRFGVDLAQRNKLEAFAHQAVALEPGPPEVSHDGAIYALQRSGQANYRSAGVTNQFERGKYWFFDYQNDAGTILRFERFDQGPWVTSVGHDVNPHEVQIDNG